MDDKFDKFKKLRKARNKDSAELTNGEKAELADLLKRMEAGELSPEEVIQVLTEQLTATGAELEQKEATIKQLRERATAAAKENRDLKRQNRELESRNNRAVREIESEYHYTDHIDPALDIVHDCEEAALSLESQAGEHKARSKKEKSSLVDEREKFYENRDKLIKQFEEAKVPFEAEIERAKRDFKRGTISEEFYNYAIDLSNKMIQKCEDNIKHLESLQFLIIDDFKRGFWKRILEIIAATLIAYLLTRIGSPDMMVSSEKAPVERDPEAITDVTDKEDQPSDTTVEEESKIVVEEDVTRKNDVTWRLNELARLSRTAKLLKMGVENLDLGPKYDHIIEGLEEVGMYYSQFCDRITSSREIVSTNGYRAVYAITEDDDKDLKGMIDEADSLLRYYTKDPTLARITETFNSTDVVVYKTERIIREYLVDPASKDPSMLGDKDSKNYKVDYSKYKAKTEDDLII